MKKGEIPKGEGIIPVVFIPLVTGCVGGRFETAGKVPIMKDIADAHPEAFAFEVTDDSMSPRYKPGVIVVTWPGEAAVDGKPAVACLKDGTVTCRLWRESRDEVTLAAEDPAYPPVTYDRGEISWAWRVAWALVEI